MNRHSAPNIPGNTLHTPVDLAAARVEVSERAEELLAHRGTPSAFVLDFLFSQLFSLYSRGSATRSRRMFELLMQPYYKAAQYSHKRGWTHQLPFYTQVRGCGSILLWCSAAHLHTCLVAVPACDAAGGHVSQRRAGGPA